MSHPLAPDPSTAALDLKRSTGGGLVGRRGGLLRSVGLLFLGMGLGLSAAEIPLLRGLSRTNLLEYRSPDGTVRRGHTKREWELRRREAIAGFLSVTGPLRGRGRARR